jgi:acyl-coenzyme A synthetase/AMP-(fatty) acid ligase
VVSERTEKEILSDLAERIDAAFIPRPLYKVESLPRSETGKLTSAALQNMWRQIRESK